jgi:hypothetical protein
MSVRRTFRIVVVLSVVLWVGAGVVEECRAQPDSVRTELLKSKGYSPDHSPRNALWRAAAVPGWGQLYNRQYLKIPFVYAGFAALGYRVYRSHQNYLLYRRAHLFGRGEEIAAQREESPYQFGEGGEKGKNPYQQYEGQYQQVKQEVFQGGTVRLQTLRDQRDNMRRQRDLTILGVGAFYALTLLDAYVSAHLLTFDVGETLSLRVHPTSSRGPMAARSVASGIDVHLRLRF